MKIKNEFKHYVLTVTLPIIGNVRKELGELKASEVKKYYAAGYLKEEWVTKSKKDAGGTIQDSVDEQDNGNA